MLQESAIDAASWSVRDVGIIVGSVSGFLALIWNIVKAVADRRARLRIDLFEESYSHVDKGTEITYRLEIFNNGPPVTIRLVYLENREPLAFRRTRRLDVVGKMEGSVPFPVRIEEGNSLIVSFTIGAPTLERYLKTGSIYASIYHSRASRPRRVRSYDRNRIVEYAMKLKSPSDRQQALPDKDSSH